MYYHMLFNISNIIFMSEYVELKQLWKYLEIFSESSFQPWICWKNSSDHTFSCPREASPGIIGEPQLVSRYADVSFSTLPRTGFVPLTG